MSTRSLACDRNQDNRADTGTDTTQHIEQNERIQQNETARVNPPLNEAETKHDDLEDRTEAKREATELVRKASATLEKMKSDEALKKLLGEAKRVFLVPQYARAAAGVGARGDVLTRAGLAPKGKFQEQLADI